MSPDQRTGPHLFIYLATLKTLELEIRREIGGLSPGRLLSVRANQEGLTRINEADDPQLYPQQQRTPPTHTHSFNELTVVSPGL